jgi:cytochrome c oxidase subunit 4
MTDTSMIDQVEERAVHDIEHEGHASDLLYIQIAFGLAVLTGMEVAWPYIVDDGLILLVPLFILMAIKFGMIGAFFMHLRFDNKILTRIFYSGLFLAVGVYFIALTTMHVFNF